MSKNVDQNLLKGEFAMQILSIKFNLQALQYFVNKILEI